MRWSRRDVLTLGGLALAGAAAPWPSLAQTPRRGGTLTVRGWDPPMQRYLARQQYYVQLASPVTIAVWDGALKNYGPNHGYDYGGRLMAAWLER